MVPQDPAEIRKLAMGAIGRLHERLSLDRVSMEHSGHPQALIGLDRLNALARQADDLKRILDREDPNRFCGANANE